MMQLADLGKRAAKLAQDHSPTIFTAIGVAGTLSTAFLTGRASYKYMKDLSEEGYYDRDYKFERSPKEHFQKSWKLFIPAASTAVFTVAAIICANRIGTRRAAAMASAYAISEKAFVEYREKVLEKIGANKEREVRDELAQDRVTKHPVTSSAVVVGAGGDVLCFETHTGRYFKSDMETLKKAQNDLNYRILSDDYASLTDFYGLIGLPRTDISDELGWNTDCKMELDFSVTLAENGQPCLAITYHPMPIRNYYKFG
jgi:hypothetical protein